MNPIQKNIKSVLEIENLPAEEQERILLSVGGIIYQNVLMRVVETMPEADQDEFEKLLDRNGSPEEIFAFLSSKVENFEKVIDEEATRFKNKTESIMSQIGA